LESPPRSLWPLLSLPRLPRLLSELRLPLSELRLEPLSEPRLELLGGLD